MMNAQNYKECGNILYNRDPKRRFDAAQKIVPFTLDVCEILPTNITHLIPIRY